MFSVVANRHGRRAILWRTLLLTFLAVTAAASLVATAIYFLYARRWNPLAPLAGAATGAFVTFVTLLLNWLTPLHRLPLARPSDHHS